MRKRVKELLDKLDEEVKKIDPKLCKADKDKFTPPPKLRLNTNI